MAVVAQPVVSHSIRRAEPRDRETVRGLIAEMAPALDPDRRLAWLYDGNVHGRAYTWLAIDHASGEVAGVTSYFPFDVSTGGEVVRGALGGDGYVRPRFRRRGIASALHAAARADMPAIGIELMYGAPSGANITPLSAGGSRPLGDVVRYLRPLRARAFGIGGPADRIAARIFAPRGGGERLDPIGPDDPRVDLVWARVRDQLGVATVRDARFYTWRFVHAPAQRQLPFAILDGDRPIAVCALERVAGRLRVIDLLAAPGDWGRALGAIARAADGCDAIEIKLMRADAGRRALWRHGFVAREAKPFLCVIPEGSARGRTLHDPERWYYTGADSDIDTLAE
jgi:GNAT superfamily N-acetyltransferase